uniref:Uncharacterized protein n=1 Tax=Rhizophora mucronata TaxID=61149 RepID=A0A2P2MC05_RHIMU
MLIAAKGSSIGAEIDIFVFLSHQYPHLTL